MGFLYSSTGLELRSLRGKPFRTMHEFRGQQASNPGMIELLTSVVLL